MLLALAVVSPALGTIPVCLEALEARRLLAVTPGLAGDYFDEVNLADYVESRVDTQINFTTGWNLAPAGTAVTPDSNYSVRWTGWVLIDQPGNWTFKTVSNDGVRLYLGNDTLFEDWVQQTASPNTATRTLPAGWQPLRLEYFQQNGTAAISLSYSGPGQLETIIPSTNLSATDPVGAPTADAGPDQFLTLPADSTTLTGSGTDEGSITAYAWSQLTGPNTANIVSPANATTAVTGLLQGIYTFQLRVTDNDNNNATDTVAVSVLPENSGDGIVHGELQTWHKVMVDFLGPQTSETATPNPFTDYRLDVTFTGPAGQTYVVPGFWAADGNAADTSAASGNVWRVNFSPDAPGEWSYAASFVTGSNVAMDGGGTPAAFNGASGTFNVTPTDKTGRDLRGKGRLEYVGERYLRFRGTNEYFLKQGPDSPENLLAYADFDGGFKSDGIADNRIKTYTPHIPDWQSGDPTWEGGTPGAEKGKGLIGAVNYLASEGLNAFSFLPMNIEGDDRNVFPYLDYNERLRMDVSRLDQWEVVFKHGNDNGFFLHFKTQETENDQLLDGGNLGPQRKLYYRELIARFGHHLALNWNLGEENTNTSQQLRDFAQFFRDTDPYDHHIVVHTFPGQKDAVYNPLLGGQSALTGASLQGSSAAFTDVHADVVKWVNNSAATGRAWAIAVDEPGDANAAIRPDDNAGTSHTDGRKNALWGTLMGGGYGNEWYFGYGYDNSDLTLQDFRSRDDWWDYTRHAMAFFEENDIPYWGMVNDNNISTAANDYGFYKPGDTYVAYLKNGGTTGIDLTGAVGTYEVKWFDPRNGGALQDGDVTSVTGGAVRNVGNPPDAASQDWAVVLRRTDEVGRILFIRGADRSGGFLETPNDTKRTEQLSDITNFQTFNGNHGWGELADTLRDEGFILDQMKEPLEPDAPITGATTGAPLNFAAMDLSQYDAIVFGSNNAIYGQADVDAVEAYIRGGGGALFISDANFGSNWGDAPRSDQFFLDRFGWVMNQDQGTYSLFRDQNDFVVPDHPILQGVQRFDGEGVSPVNLADPDAVGQRIAVAKGNTRVNNGIGQGPSRAVTGDDASLAAAAVDAGRLVAHFDRNTFFNQNGAGTNINRFDNRQYAINLFNYLAGVGEFAAIDTATFDRQQDQRVEISLTADVANSIGAEDLVLTNLTTGLDVDPARFEVTYVNERQLTVNILPGSGDAYLADGNYRLTIAGATTGLISDETTDFFVLAGDANGDRQVNLEDFNLLAINFGRSDDPTYEEGDFNYDGAVNLADFNLLAINFGKSIDEPLPAEVPVSLAASKDGSVFSSRPIRSMEQSSNGRDVLGRRDRSVLGGD
ncbi:MAG: DUF5060 domain-containing protein [Phycisphaerae bacterium]